MGVPEVGTQPHRVPLGVDCSPDRPRLEDVILETRSMIEGYVAKRVLNRDHRDEVVSRIYLSLVRAWPDFRGECKPSSFVLVIAANALKNYRQRDLAKERRQVSLENWSEEVYVPRTVGSRCLHEDVERRNETAGLMREMRRVCSAEQCAVTELVYQGQSMDEIGSTLGIKTDTVRSHFKRGRERLLAHLLIEAPEYLGGSEAVEDAVGRLERDEDAPLTREEADAIRRRKGPAELLRRAMLKVAPYLAGVIWLAGGGW